MESTDSSTSSQQPHLPPGFRFHPTDEELVVHYLKKKAASAPLPVTIIAEVDLYKFDPWELPSKATFGEQEWYFFSPRDRKYPNGARPNRAATSGYWKATGTDKPILTSNGNQKVGVKKALVFYGGKPPKGIKSNWIMHEYRLVTGNNNNSAGPKPLQIPDVANKKNSLRLDDWVLCRIYKKNNAQRPMERESSREDSYEGMYVSAIPSHQMHTKLVVGLQLPGTGGGRNTSNSSYGSLLLEHEHDHDQDQEHFFEGLLQQNSCVSQLASSSCSTKPPPHQAAAIVSAPTNNIDNNTKRAMPPQFWNEASSSGKRFIADLNTGSGSTAAATDDDHDHSNSFVSLLSQLPQSVQSYNTNSNTSALLGSLAEATTLRQQFQLPTMDWNS